MICQGAALGHMEQYETILGPRIRCQNHLISGSRCWFLPWPVSNGMSGHFTVRAGELATVFWLKPGRIYTEAPEKCHMACFFTQLSLPGFV